MSIKTLGRQNPKLGLGTDSQTTVQGFRGLEGFREKFLAGLERATPSRIPRETP